MKYKIEKWNLQTRSNQFTMMNEQRAAQSQRGEDSEIRDDTPNLHTNIVDYWKKTLKTEHLEL